MNNYENKLLGNISNSTVQRNARRSSSWLLNKIQKNKDIKKVTKPIIGKMYLFVYNPKTKDTLPFYDVNPLIIPISFRKGGFIGLNFHYLPIKERKELLRAIVPFSRLTTNSDLFKVSISYSKLLKLTGPWKFTLKRYLYSHLRTQLIEIPPNEWENIISLPLAHFKKSSMSAVHAQRKK